jgi:hypothetical protein
MHQHTAPCTVLIVWNVPQECSHTKEENKKAVVELQEAKAMAAKQDETMKKLKQVRMRERTACGVGS